MSGIPSKRQIILARVVAILLVSLVFLGLVEYFFSPHERQSMLRDILARPGGPMTFRFILQPAMAAIAAFRDGMNDVRMGRSPYLWTVLSSQEERRGRLYEGLISTAQIILLGLVMDIIYQFIVFKKFYYGQAVIVALLLAFLPYLLLRGPIARIARLRRGDLPLNTDPRTKKRS